MPFTPNSIAPIIVQMDAQAVAIDAEIGACKTLNPPTLAAQWLAFYAGYMKWSKASKAELSSTYAMLANPIDYALTVNEIGNDTNSYQGQMNEWAAIADKQCGGHAGQTGGGGADPTLILELVVGLAAIGAGVYALFTFAPFIRAVGTSRARRR